MEFSDFTRLSLNGDRPKKVNGKDDQVENLRWTYTPTSCIGVYELHARHDNGHRITSGCVPVFAQPSRKPVKDSVVLEMEKKLAKDEFLAKKAKKRIARKKRELVEKAEQEEQKAEAELGEAEDEEETKTTRSGRRLKRPATFNETLEFSSGSDTERGGRRRRKRRKSKDVNFRRGDRAVGEYPVNMNIVVRVSRQELSKSFPLSLSWEPSSRKVVVAEVNTTASGKPSLFRRVKPDDVLVSVNGKKLEDMYFYEHSNVNMEVQKVAMNRKTCVFKFIGKRTVRARLATLKYDPIEPQAIYDCVEDLGGFEEVCSKMLWQKVRLHLKLKFTTSSGYALRKAYDLYFGDL